MIVGIDLGTTHSLCAYWTPEGPVLIPNALGENLTPSVVGVDEKDHVLVGRPAREYQVLCPDRCAAAFKRHMGSDWTATLGKRKFNSVELSSLVLRSLRTDAEALLGMTVDEAVITVPAYFNEHQRQATIKAGQLAGFQVRRILNEPTAAAIAYGVHEAKQDSVFLVYDLGGGTFDVSIMDRFEGALEIRASAGEVFLGGEDFTRALAARILEQRGLVFERAEMETPKLVSRLRHECEQAKRLLAREPHVIVRVPNAMGDVPPDAPTVAVARTEFDAWTESILVRTEIPLRRALGDARLKRSDIADVLLVGGATRMASVRQRIATMFGREPRCSLNPDEVVALGAAVQAGLVGRDESLNDLVVTDVAPFTLGVETSNMMGMEARGGYFLPVINRNTTIPVSRVVHVQTLYPNQTEVSIKLYQGEARRVEENFFLGEFDLKGIPRGPKGQAIEIRFTYDLNGVLEVEATIVETKKSVQHIVTRHAKGMTSAQIAAAVEQMQKLKTHPRDETVNRTLLLRAERVYQELPLAERDFLNQLISGFEEAMELQDPASMASHREMLERFLDQFDRTDDDSQEF